MKKVIVLLGPTGVGKTAASLLLAEHLGADIISSDSMQIYRGMDIGTAKPTPEERARVRHHMIDVVEPWESYSSGRYLGEVRPIIGEMHAKGQIPLVVGGTGLYIKAMTRGIFEGPPADWDLREKLLAEEEAAPGSLFRRLGTVDPETAGRLKPGDLRRIVRALEVCLKGGATMSEMQARHTEKLPCEFVKVGLTRDRAELYDMIDRRVDQMIEAGLADEVRRVIDAIRSSHPGLIAEVSSLQAIGYKELIGHFEGRVSFADAVGLIKQRSRNYAKRQFTWFRKEEDIRWIDITGIYEPEIIAGKLIS
jgi:tRNA dimethylallyltransferase